MSFCFKFTSPYVKIRGSLESKKEHVQVASNFYPRTDKLLGIDSKAENKPRFVEEPDMLPLVRILESPYPQLSYTPTEARH